jgi:hypothetical protein
MRAQIKACSDRLFDSDFVAEAQEFISEMARADRLNQEAYAIRKKQWAIYRECLGIKPKAKKGGNDAGI